MTRRVITAREQHEMLSPWRLAATEPFPLSSVMRVPEDNGRYRIDYHSGPEPGQRGIHTWTVSPASYPAVDSYTTQYGQDKTLYYDPAVIQPRRGDLGHEYEQPPNAQIKDVAPGDQGLLWRGMSHEEYENAKRQGYFESQGGGNIGDDQNGLTLFSTGVRDAGVYAASGASQHRAVFGKPAHIVGIPMRPWDWELDHEKGIRGRIPFSDVAKHYVGHPYAIKPGKIQVVHDDRGLSVLGGGGGIGTIYHAWHEDHPQ